MPFCFPQLSSFCPTLLRMGTLPFTSVASGKRPFSCRCTTFCKLFCKPCISFLPMPCHVCFVLVCCLLLFSVFLLCWFVVIYRCFVFVCCSFLVFVCLFVFYIFTVRLVYRVFISYLKLRSMLSLVLCFLLFFPSFSFFPFFPFCVCLL